MKKYKFIILKLCFLGLSLTHCAPSIYTVCKNSKEAKELNVLMDTYSCNNKEVYFNNTKYEFVEAFTSYSYIKKSTQDSLSLNKKVFIFKPLFKNIKTGDFDFFSQVLLGKEFNNEKGYKKGLIILNYYKGAWIEKNVCCTHNDGIAEMDYLISDFSTSPDSIKVICSINNKDEIIMFIKNH